MVARMIVYHYLQIRIVKLDAYLNVKMIVMQIVLAQVAPQCVGLVTLGLAQILVDYLVSVLLVHHYVLMHAHQLVHLV